LAALAVLGLAAVAAAADVAPLLARIKADGKEGAGNVEAARAWKELVRRGPDLLLDVLAALDDANPVAANYLRAVGEAIAARDSDQVKLIAGRLKTLGVTVDLTSHFGFLTRWLIAGPFDNRGGAGFHTTFAPERGVEVAATYRGKDNKELSWTPYVCTAPLG